MRHRRTPYTGTWNSIIPPAGSHQKGVIVEQISPYCCQWFTTCHGATVLEWVSAALPYQDHRQPKTPRNPSWRADQSSRVVGCGSEVLGIEGSELLSQEAKRVHHGQPSIRIKSPCLTMCARQSKVRRLIHFAPLFDVAETWL